MRLNLTVEITDSARNYLAALYPVRDKTAAGQATKDAIRAHLQEHCDDLSRAFQGAHKGPLKANEVKDAEEAITYLRAQGRTDEQIRAWLLIQRARYHFKPGGGLDAGTP